MYTLGQFIDAMEIDDYPQAYGDLFNTDYYPFSAEEFIVDACALGQGHLNTGTRMTTGAYQDISSDDNTTTFYHFITTANDGNKRPVSEIARIAREKFSKQLDRFLYLYPQDYSKYKNYKGVQVQPTPDWPLSL